MLIETVDARIARAHKRLKQARFQGHPAVIASAERDLDRLLDMRFILTHDPEAGKIRLKA